MPNDEYDEVTVAYLIRYFTCDHMGENATPTQCTPDVKTQAF